MRTSWAKSLPAYAAATAVLLSGCDVGTLLGDGPEWIVVQNDTPASVHAGGTDYADGKAEGIGTTIEAGQAGEVGWTQCKTACLVVRASKQVSSKEHGRFELELCPGDLVTIAPDYTVTVDEQ